MKNKIFAYGVLLALVFTACSTEDDLEPSDLDNDRVSTQLDMSNPLVKRWFTDYNTGVLYEYDRLLDFVYVASSAQEAASWEGVELPELSTLYSDENGVFIPSEEEAYKAHVQASLEFLDANLFAYFKPNSKVATLMPHKVLISESIFSNGNIPGGKVLTESEERFSSSNQYGQRAVFNRHSIVFALNQDEFQNDPEGYTKDNFYIFLTRLMNMHNLYAQLPESFFTSKENYYGKEMEAIYREELGIGEEKTVYVIDKNWFYSKGFIDAIYFYNGSSGLRSYTQSFDEDGNRLPTRITHLKAIRPNYDFVDSREIDVRSYINEMIYRDADEFLEFPQNIQDNLKPYWICLQI